MKLDDQISAVVVGGASGLGEATGRAVAVETGATFFRIASQDGPTATNAYVATKAGINGMTL